MKKYKIFSIFFIVLLGLFFINSCKAKVRMGSTEITLDAADNIIVNGRSVTLIYNTQSQSNGFTLVFQTNGSLTCADVSIITTGAYAFVSNNQIFLPAPINTSSSQYTCTKNGNTISLSTGAVVTNALSASTDGFRPWVNNFNIKLKQTIFNVSVESTLVPTQKLTRGIQTEMNLDSSFSGCGLNGTVLQRVFDCSKMITNYGVTVSATQAACGSSDSANTCTYYTPFASDANSDAYWFVVACPAGTGGTVPQQSCAWLTPVVPNDNPALDTQPVQTFTLNLMTGYQKRLLWSGKMTRDNTGYNFSDANGFADSSAQVYTQSSVNPGAGAGGPQPTPNPASVCNASSGAALVSGTFPASDAAIRDLISSSSGATINWEVPTYPMQNIITGGTPTISNGAAACPATSAVNTREFCNAPASTLINQGFSALNVPGFVNTGEKVSACDSNQPNWNCIEMMWSSSSGGSGNGGWLNMSLQPLNSPNSGGAVFPLSFTSSKLLGVRCISLAWY